VRGRFRASSDLVSKHVVILGAGVIGLSTALYCARQGLSVTVIDRKPRQRDGCSFGNAGMVVPSHFIPLAAPGMVALGLKWMWNPESPFYIKPSLSSSLLRWSWEFWKASTPEHVGRSAPLLRDMGLLSRQCFDEVGLDIGLVKRGLLMLCKEQHTLEEEGHSAEKARQLGLPAEVLDAAATAALDPNVTMDVIGSVFFPKDCHMDPSRYIAAVEAELIQRGAQFHWDTEVTGFVHESNELRSVLTTQGAVEAQEFVLCSGVWSEEIAAQLRLTLPMQAGKGYSLTLPNPAQLPELCSICTEARLAVTPMGGSLRVGGTMEIAGKDESVTQRRVQGIVKAFPRYFPKFRTSDFEGIQPWRGLRPVSPDGMPYVGRAAAWRNLVVATGHAMMGLSLAPITGKVVTQILTEQKTELDLTLLSPDRFA
jgi:D-amino-acid dehydrogenase